MRQNQRIGLREIALATNVSINTVSRALKGKEDIAEGTRLRIQQVAQDLGYQPHLVARSLASGKSMTIGIVVFDLAHCFFSETVSVIISDLEKRGYFSNVMVTGTDPEHERKCLGKLVSMSVDGIILVPLGTGPEYEAYLRSLHCPIVTLGNYVANDWSFVGVNERQAMADAVEHIRSKGYEHIMYVSPPLDLQKTINAYTLNQRYSGYLEEMSTLGLDPMVVRGKSYLDEIEAYLHQAGRPRTAILCSNDNFCLNVLIRLRRMGLDVPRDAGLMGFDNIDTLRFVQPALTTVDYNIGSFGHAAVDCMMNLIKGLSKGEGMSMVIIPHRIIAGESL